MNGKEEKCEDESSRGAELIVEEYQHTKEQLQIQLGEKKAHHFPCFNADLRTVLAFLKAALKEAVEGKEDIVDPLLVLKEYTLTVEGQSMVLNCNFGWVEELLETLSPEVYSLSYSTSLSFSGGN